MVSTEQNQLLAEIESGNTSIANRNRLSKILAYARKLTENPALIEQADIDSLRAVGLDNRAIHDVCAIVAYFAFVNRIADGLGVQLEST